MSDAELAAGATNQIRIGDRRIGPGHPCFVIAEAGVNHNGQVDLAIALVEAAHAAGADSVKFQTFSADRVAIASAEMAPYQKVTTGSIESQIEMIGALELPLDAYPKIKERCRELGVIFLSTPANREDVDFLEQLGVEAYKVASFQIVELELLDYIARKRKPVLLATGMAMLAEIDEAVRVMRQAGNTQIVLLQCTTNYPSRVEDANLRVLPIWREAFGTLVGYSDHTDTAACAVASIALGAVVLEKHLTLDRSMRGPDHQASADPDGFRHMVSLVRDAELALGTGRKEPSAQELVNLPFMRRSLVMREAVPAGTTLTSSMLTAKRPGTGISAARLQDVLGSRVRFDVPRDHVLTWQDLDWAE